MAAKERTPWFGPHKTGIGWGPVTWQGYLVCLVAIVVTVVITRLIRQH